MGNDEFRKQAAAYQGYHISERSTSTTALAASIGEEYDLF